MAKSKSGGTRSYIRGRVGADVYSIGKDAKGAKQQVVRSLAETVANPQTVAQMRGRMIMSSVMQALSQLRPIVDHSFDQVTGVQPNLSEFIRLNYAAVKADVAAHPASGNLFGLNMYQEKGAKRGQYVVSEGKAAWPAAASLVKSTAVLTIALGDNGATISGLSTALGLGDEGYMTIVGIAADGTARYARLHVNTALAGSTAIAAGNVAQAFKVSGNAVPAFAISGTNITATLDSVKGCCACIITRKGTDGFIHSSEQLGDGTGFESSANVALPTYPVGAQKFLNGGGEVTAANSSSSSSSSTSGDSGDDNDEPSGVGG